MGVPVGIFIEVTKRQARAVLRMNDGILTAEDVSGIMSEGVRRRIREAMG